MKIIRIFLTFALFAFAWTGTPARAAEAVYPPGVRVGLVPLPGLKAATDFAGFISDDEKVKVGFTELPEAAFSAVETAVKEGRPPQQGNAKPEPFQAGARQAFINSETGKDGDAPVRNFSLLIPGEKFSGYVIVQIRDGADKSFTDEAIRGMLATTVTRSEVPVQEQLSQLAFDVTDLAGFKNVRTIGPRSAVLLTDASPDDTLNSAPYMMIGVLQAAPAQPDDRGRFARDVAATIPGLRDTKMTSNEPVRIGGTPGFETRIEGVTGKDNTPVTVVQWLRFANGGNTLRIIGGASTQEWPQAFPRFRTVRDGIGPR